MTRKNRNAFKGATAALAAALIATQTAVADPAILMGSTICQNQRDSFDFAWLTANHENLQPFFISGDDAHGVITPLGHANPFNDSADVYISIHGDVDEVGDFSGANFAASFLANHATTPDSVTFYVCQSSTVPAGGVSSMAALARSYPGPVANSTAIGAVDAPEPDTCPALAVNAAAEPFAPIATIQPAVYRTLFDETDGHDAALGTLEGAWDDAAGTPYPGSDLSFEDYCAEQLAADATGATWVLEFINAVEDQFANDYLALINTNYAGNAFVSCGPGVQCD